MTLQDLYEALDTAGFSAHYGEAPDGTSCPYVVLTDITNPNILADNKTFFKTTECTLTLVEAFVHDFELQASLEEVLDGLDLPYTMSESWLPEEHVIETYYTLAIYGGVANAEES